MRLAVKVPGKRSRVYHVLTWHRRTPCIRLSLHHLVSALFLEPCMSPDQIAQRRRVVEAARTLASQRAWSDVSLVEVAAAAGMSMADLRTAGIGSKSQIVAALLRDIDEQVLAKVTGPTTGQSARDTLFEVIMSRFDAMQPYKAAIRSISEAGVTDTSLVMPFLNSQRWMLAAAGIDADGPGGLVRTAGLGAAYRSAFNIWLSDDDPGMAKTMAALDQRLRSGERTMSAIDGTLGGITRIARDLPGVLRDVFNRRREPKGEPKTEPPA
jgi:ubiquinone biosynthesis protein COQ9